MLAMCWWDHLGGIPRVLPRVGRDAYHVGSLGQGRLPCVGWDHFLGNTFLRRQQVAVLRSVQYVGFALTVSDPTANTSNMLKIPLPTSTRTPAAVAINKATCFVLPDHRPKGRARRNARLRWWHSPGPAAQWSPPRPPSRLARRRRLDILSRVSWKKNEGFS